MWTFITTKENDLANTPCPVEFAGKRSNREKV
jgi:hypothetical protein